MRSFSIERQRTQPSTPDIGAQPDPTSAVFPLFSGRAGEGGAAGGGVAAECGQVAFRRNVRFELLVFIAIGWSRPYPASQGNRASSTAMARAVVSWGGTRTGMAAGDVVRRGRRGGRVRRV